MSIYVADPIPEEYPDPDCPTCDGEGKDLDRFGMFDHDMRGPCPDCWKEAALPQEDTHEG